MSASTSLRARSGERGLRIAAMKFSSARILSAPSRETRRSIGGGDSDSTWSPAIPVAATDKDRVKQETSNPI